MSIQSEYLTLSKYPHTSNKLFFIDFNQTKKRNAIIPYLFKTLPLPPVKIHPINTPMSAPSRSYLHEYTHPSVYFLSRTCRTHLLCVSARMVGPQTHAAPCEYTLLCCEPQEPIGWCGNARAQRGPVYVHVYVYMRRSRGGWRVAGTGQHIRTTIYRCLLR